MPEPTIIDTLSEEIKAELSPELLTDQNITKYKTIPDLLKGHTELAKMVSAKGVIIPKDGAPAEEWDKFYNALGRPEKADGYKLTEIKGLHPAIKITPESTKVFLDFAHKNGFTNKQSDTLNAWYLNIVSQMLTKQDEDWNARVLAAETALKTKWGTDYDKNLTITKEFVNKKGGQALIDALAEKINDPVVLEFLFNEGVKYAEDEVKRLGTGGGGGEESEALKKIKAIQEDKAHPYWNINDPKHSEAIEEVTKLYKQAYPETPPA
jgi:hypothetical protein